MAKDLSSLRCQTCVTSTRSFSPFIKGRPPAFGRFPVPGNHKINRLEHHPTFKVSKNVRVQSGRAHRAKGKRGVDTIWLRSARGGGFLRAAQRGDS
jgi:hypothetical protein